MRSHLMIPARLVAVGDSVLGLMATNSRLNELFALEEKEATPEMKGTPAVLPRPDYKFPGKVGKTVEQSDPAKFPQPVSTPKGAPNVVLILLDDTVFGQYAHCGGRC